MTATAPLRVGQTLTGPLFNEPMRVETVAPSGDCSWVVGLVGVQTERFRRVALTEADLAALSILESLSSYDGDGKLLRLGLQAYSLGIAYEFDPYFGLSISKVDPLPHQLEAVYDYLLKLARVRFLLADDAVFNVVGEILPAAHIERVLRDYYAGKLGDADLDDRLLHNVDEGRFRAICQSALEGLAAKRLNLEMLIERRARAERLFAVELADGRAPCRREPALLGDLIPAPSPQPLPEREGGGEGSLPAAAALPEAIAWLQQSVLVPFLEEVRSERQAEVERVAEHVELSLTELLARADQEIGKAQESIERGEQGAEGRLAQAEARHEELQARRQRRRKQLQQERALTLQAVERLTSVLVLPHPERESPEVRRLRPNLQTEAIAMQVVIDHERSQGREVYDVHEQNLGYDVTSLDLRSGELRLIEVKGLADATGTILLTPNERRVAEDRRDCYWLYVVTNCATAPQLQEPIKDPARFPWHEVTKVAHYWLEVNAMTKPMVIREDPPPGSPQRRREHRDGIE